MDADGLDRIVVGVFALGVRRGVLVRSPVEGLVDTEKPSQKNKKQIARLDSQKVNALVATRSHYGFPMIHPSEGTSTPSTKVCSANLRARMAGAASVSTS